MFCPAQYRYNFNFQPCRSTLVYPLRIKILEGLVLVPILWGLVYQELTSIIMYQILPILPVRYREVS